MMMRVIKKICQAFIFILWFVMIIPCIPVLGYVSIPSLSPSRAIHMSRLVAPPTSSTLMTSLPSNKRKNFRYPCKSNPRASAKNTSTSTALNANTNINTSTSLSAAVATAAATRGIGTHYLVRIVFLRGLAFVYMVAFLVAYRQNKALIGDNGITPAKYTLDHIEKRAVETRQRREEWWKKQKEGGKTRIPIAVPPSEYSGNFMTIWKNTKIARILGDELNSSQRFQRIREVLWDRSDRLGRLYPTVLWLMSKEDRETKMNQWLDGIALTGLGLSLSMFVFGSANVPILLSLWVCQRSIMSVGGPWYGFGWEPQLAELTFHAMFMAPFLSLSPIPYTTPVPTVSIWAMRWFLFRIMIGAGLIKLRSGDPKWKIFKGDKDVRLSTMDYFYETQPVPNPNSRFFHKMPKLWHRFEVLMNHFVELVAPWLLILPGIGRKWRITGGLIQLVFQAVLITSGNLSFLNWLTMLPAIYCLDDAFVSKLFSPGYTTSASIAAYTHLAASGVGSMLIRNIMNIVFATLIIKLSIPVVKNLMSKRQIMNGSFDPLRLVNTYGAFGTVEEVRTELIIEAASEESGPWREYEFKVKPGSVKRRPRFISPYHYRLDWLMWIVALGNGIEQNPWICNFLKKLLEQDPEVMKLMANDPFRDTDEKPRYIRVTRYKYKFNDIGEKDYWVREPIGRFFPKDEGICSLDMLEAYTAS